ncbi:MAG: hypothetical protein JXN10_00125 [Clostridia bacterium]|nr:hypothetical protein [Clostridia bacterium]MBN2881905.1 hypothetical protein [Clostridia bacterium]
MTKANTWQTVGIFFLSISVLLAGLFIGLSLRHDNEANSVMTIEQASKYLDLSTEDITDIIIWESAHSEIFNSEIMKLPYYIVDRERYFNSADLASWVHNVSTRRVFNKFVSMNIGWATN